VIDIAETPRLFGDRDLLIEAVGNLVDNAIKFTPEGRTVNVTLTVRHGLPLIQVADTGPGIAEDERETVFSRFHRSAQQVPGVGLGLSLVAAIAKLHDIRITLRDDVPGCMVELAFAGVVRRRAEYGPVKIWPVVARKRR